MKSSCSQAWLKPGSRQCLLRRALVKSMGYTDADLARPIVGVINTWAETNPGHYNFRQLADAVKRGVWAAGGFPLEVNTMSICEVFFDISSMIFRNLLAMTTEELISRHPFDGVILLGSCDKNVPAQLMAAVSANKPMLFLPGGPMLPGNYKGESLACGTDSFKLWTQYQAGEIDEEELKNVEGCLYGSVGACPIMGTANSMQCASESLGLALPGSASALAVSAEKMRYAEESGRQIMTLIERGITPRDIVTREAIENAITVLMSSGGSTNLIIHLTAIARRAGIDLPLSEFQRLSDRTRVLVDVKPSGKGTVGIEFHQAGGVPVLMKELEALLHTDVMTVTGKTLKENLAAVPPPYRPDVIVPFDKPFRPPVASPSSTAISPRAAQSSSAPPRPSPASVAKHGSSTPSPRRKSTSSTTTPTWTRIRRSFSAATAPKARPACPSSAITCPYPLRCTNAASPTSSASPTRA